LIFRRNRKHTRAVLAFFVQLAELYKVTIPESALAGVA
jgi:HD superfamily phosphohydrolase YqeK